MAAKKSALARANNSIVALKAIVRAERKRAEANPMEQRYVDFSIADQSSNRTGREKSIFETFNDLEYLLDRLHVTYMAACFESEAKTRIATAIGETRNAVGDALGTKPWAINLVLSKEDFYSINDVFEVLGLSSLLKNSAGAIKDVRNAFCHGSRIENLPIDSNETFLALAQMLESLAPGLA